MSERERELTDATGAQPTRRPPKRDAGQISDIMRRVRGRDTTPEIRLRRALWARGLRYGVARAELPGKPDIVFPGARLAVFVDGDYWHGNQWRRRGKAALEEQFASSAAASRAYWLRKIRSNMRRDCESSAALLRMGWVVLRLWESQITADMEGCVSVIADTLGAQRTGAGATGGPGDALSTLRGRLPQKTCAEFFAGIGLMRLGLERQGWRVTFANDIDERKRAMYQAHFGGMDGEEGLKEGREDAAGNAASHFVLGDVHTLPMELVPSVTLATASFPCNDLSLAGARQGLAGAQSSAFWGFIRILDELGARRPPLVLLENVPGFLTSHGGADFTRALRALDALGYVVDAFQLDAARFTPQSRRRLFVVGTQATLLGEQYTAPTELASSETRPQALLDAIAANTSVRWQVRPLPAPPERELRLEGILDDLPESAPEWWSQERASYLLSQMSPRHRALADEMIAGDRWSYGTVFRRMRAGRSMAELRADGLAGCLRTPRGGSGRQILFKAGFGRYQARLLTPREAARLMGAGDFRISGSLNDALFGFGDAVCADAITWIATYYLDPLINELIRGAPLRAGAAPATMMPATTETR